MTREIMDVCGMELGKIWVGHKPWHGHCCGSQAWSLREQREKKERKKEINSNLQVLPSEDDHVQ